MGFREAGDDPEHPDRDGGDRRGGHQAARPAQAGLGADGEVAQQGGEEDHGAHGAEAVGGQVDHGVRRAEREGREHPEEVGAACQSVEGANGEGGVGVVVGPVVDGFVGFLAGVKVDVDVGMALVFVDVGVQAPGIEGPVGVPRFRCR